MKASVYHLEYLQLSGLDPGCVEHCDDVIGGFCYCPENKDPTINEKINIQVYAFLYQIIRPDQFDFWEHGFFSKFEGLVGQKKREIKKNPQFFALALIINKNFL